MRWELEEKYIENDPNLYYDGWLDYGYEKDTYLYLREFSMYEDILYARNEILNHDVKPDFITTRGRCEYACQSLDEFICYNDVIMDVYSYRYSHEPLDFEELRQYFIEGSFLHDAEDYLKALNYYKGTLKRVNSLKDGSKGEKLVREYLIDGNYDFKEQESDGCYNEDTLHGLVFDFVVYINKVKIYIEVQGKQHYEPVSFSNEDFETSEINFYRQKHRDGIKKKFAEKHGVYIALDYREGNLNKLKERIENELLPVLKGLWEEQYDNKK